MITLTCMGCGTEFSRPLNQHKQNLRRGRTIIACSIKCVNPARHGEPRVVTANCNYCGAEFSRRPSSKDKMLYCSCSCSANANNRRGPQIVRTCRFCECQEKMSVRRICKACEAAGKKGRAKKADWSCVTLLDLKNKYSISQYHAKLRMISRNEYKRSGMPMQCAVDGYSLHVDICHIRDIKDFPMSAKVSDVNHIDNLVALCKRCHWEFDNGYIKLSSAQNN